MTWLDEQLRKRRIRFKDVCGLEVVLAKDTETRGGTKFYKGERLKLGHTHQGRFHLSTADNRMIRHVYPRDLDVPEDEREEFLKSVQENRERDNHDH